MKEKCIILNCSLKKRSIGIILLFYCFGPTCNPLGDNGGPQNLKFQMYICFSFYKFQMHIYAYTKRKFFLKEIGIISLVYGFDPGSPDLKAVKTSVAFHKISILLLFYDFDLTLGTSILSIPK